jgi:hypothetical protein
MLRGIVFIVERFGLYEYFAKDKMQSIQQDSFETKVNFIPMFYLDGKVKFEEKEYL